MAKDYLRYTADDFIADEYFQRWVRTPDRESTAFWNNWMAEHPEQRDDIMKASAFINHLNFKLEEPDTEKIDASLNRSLQVIQEKESSWRFRLLNKAVLKNLMWMAAICVAVVVSFSVWKYYQGNVTTVEVTTVNKEIKKVMLPDSTFIILNANSALKYSSTINESSLRELWLNGEAFFQVKPLQQSNGANRLIVHTNDLDVEVQGTSFNIKKRDDTYNVSLNTGSIKITLNDEGSIIFLAPGDFFQYSKNDQSHFKKKVKAELYSDWQDEKMVLNNTSLPELADLIDDIYGYNIIIEKTLLSNERISGTILFKDEQTFLDALKFLLNINIIKKDKDLIFESKQQP